MYSIQNVGIYVNSPTTFLNLYAASQERNVEIESNPIEYNFKNNSRLMYPRIQSKGLNICNLLNSLRSDQSLLLSFHGNAKTRIGIIKRLVQLNITES